MTRHILVTLISTFFFTFTALAQKKNYTKEWLVIEQLEVDGKATSALEKVNTLHLKAERSKNNEQILKTLLFRWKFQQIIDEKSQEKILEEVTTEIEKQKFPNKQLLEMYLANFLESHLNDTFWNIKNRTSTENAALKDYRTWDLNTFLNQISLHYERALTPHLALATTPTNQITELLVSAPLSRKNKPSLYDIIAHEALDFYTNSRNRVNKPKDEFLINQSNYFANSNTFIKSTLKTTDKESLLFKALKTYQQLEEIHAQKKNEAALVNNILTRLAFVKVNYIGKNKDTAYLESLKSMSSQFSSAEAQSKFQAALAKSYRDLAFKKDENKKYINPTYNTLALNLCKDIIAKNKDEESVTNAKNLQQSILQKKAEWVTQNTFLPNQPHLAKITFTNAQEIKLTAYRVPYNFELNNFNYKDRDSLTTAYFKNKKVSFSESYSLPNKSDYNSYSTELVVPKLATGTYYFKIETDTITKSAQFHKIQVTELTLNKTESDFGITYQVLNRYSGEPLSNITAVVKTQKNRNSKEYISQKHTTNTWGEFAHQKPNQYEASIIEVYSGLDTLSVGDYNYRRYEKTNYQQELKKYRSKTLLFLDRAIYRPKQKVYFKVIALSEENQLSQAIANTPIDIIVSNPNREEVFKTSLTTNEFGSVHGEFNLPEGGLNGQYFISANLQKPKNRQDHSNASERFSVEEYKRPTFEVTFKPSTKIFKPLDSVQAHGNAKAFLGSAITNATVTYSVKRTTQYRNWWYSRSFNNDTKQITTGEVITDNEGNFTVPFKAETDTKDTKGKIFNYEIEVKVTDINGETRIATSVIKVAEKNLLATINTEENWDATLTPSLEIDIKDINGNAIKAKGKLHIHKLESSGRFLKTRPWTVPDIQNISENDFTEQFPHIPYTNEDKPENWKKSPSLFESKFSETEKQVINLPGLKKWAAGTYIIITEITDHITKAKTESQKSIRLLQPNESIPADEKLLEHQVISNSKNQAKITIELKTAAPQLIVFAQAYDGDTSIWKEKITLKKGSKSIDISLPKLTYPNVTIQYSYQIHNQFYTTNDAVDFSKEPINLTIEKTHFRDKINPGLDEKWSFILKSSNNKSFNAEALASMYDASLDQFTKSSWSTNFGFGKNYPKPKATKSLTRVGLANLNYKSPLNHFKFSKIANESLNLFGFEFNQVNSWNYKKYLKRLKYKIENINNPDALSNYGNETTQRPLMSKNAGVKILDEDNSRKSKISIRGVASSQMKPNEMALMDAEDSMEMEEETATAPKTKNQKPEADLAYLKSIKARTNLQETAFFLPNLRTNKKGEIEFEFAAPEALTRWNFRMLAHTPKGLASKLNAQTLTQKELNIIPNAPRFVREGDTLRFSAKVANLTDQVMNGTALLEWTDPTNAKSLNTHLSHIKTTQNFSIDANGNSVLNWKIIIPENLTAIQYKIVAKAGNFTDGEEKIIPVLSNRMLVTESIPLWVRAGETENYTLTNFDSKSATQKPHAITLEYTSNPAWLAIKSLPYLMEFPHECSEQTFSRLYANTVASHIINSQPKIKAVFDSWAANETLQSPLETNKELKSILISESPWLQEAKSETEQQKRLGELFDLAKTAKANESALNKLRQLQKSNGGFPWFKSGKANPFITRHILAGFGHLEQLNITKQRTKTDNMVKNMIQFLDSELENDLQKHLKQHKDAEGFYNQVSLLHYAYARSFYISRFPLKGETKNMITKALAFHKNNWQQRSIYEKGLLALSLHRFEKSPIAQKILSALTESAVQSKENGMYWKQNTNSWWWYKNSVSTQALLIEAFAEMKQPKKYIEEMKIYLLKNKRTNRWESTIQTANASYALLLDGNDWLSVKDNTIIKVGGENIATKKLVETEKEQGTGYLKSQWKAEEITSEFANISVTNKSTVTGYGGYYWQYFEHLDKIKTDDKSPLSIQKELYKKTTTDKGTELKLITHKTPLKIGDKVTVRLLVKSDNEMEFVHLKDMRASSFEPTQVLSGYQYKDRLGYYQSTKDVATHFFVDNLPKGNYVLEYDVIANQNGSFSNGITTLQSMYAPEFSSHSAGQRVDILE